jgi:peptidyl-prolyl cis-trans isomerase B (cyclophilin B)
MKLATATALLLLLVSCSGAGTDGEATATTTVLTETTATETAATETTATTATVAQEEKPMSEYTNKIAEITTGKGKIVLRFFPDVAPNHVRNFVDLAEQGFYNGTRFHRVIPGFMIQGGDPNTKTDNRSSWGMGGSSKNVNAEFNSKPHVRGIVSMARAQSPNSASSQFFIVVADSRFLDNQYTVFGEVLSGMEVADAIVSAPTTGDTPVDPVKIESVTIREATSEEKAAK